MEIFSVNRNNWKYVFEFNYKVYLILPKIKDVHSSSFIITKTENNPNAHQQEDKQIVVHLSIQWNYYQAWKGKVLLIHVTIWLTLKTGMLCERSFFCTSNAPRCGTCLTFTSAIYPSVVPVIVVRSRTPQKLVL